MWGQVTLLTNGRQASETIKAERTGTRGQGHMLKVRKNGVGVGWLGLINCMS